LDWHPLQFSPLLTGVIADVCLLIHAAAGLPEARQCLAK
jgi:hypothetical protein